MHAGAPAAQPCSNQWSRRQSWGAAGPPPGGGPHGEPGARAQPPQPDRGRSHCAPRRGRRHMLPLHRAALGRLPHTPAARHALLSCCCSHMRCCCVGPHASCTSWGVCDHAIVLHVVMASAMPGRRGARARRERQPAVPQPAGALHGQHHSHAPAQPGRQRPRLRHRQPAPHGRRQEAARQRARLPQGSAATPFASHACMHAMLTQQAHAQTAARVRKLPAGFNAAACAPANR